MIKSALRFLPATLASMLIVGGVKPLHAAGPGWEESGKASWYGERHHGRRTSSGEIFDQNRMTAAHPSLPLGTRVRVTLRDTGESVLVTINDRQPKGARVIDLSRGAASRIGMLHKGVAMVRLAVVQPSDG